MGKDIALIAPLDPVAIAINQAGSWRVLGKSTPPAGAIAVPPCRRFDFMCVQCASCVSVRLVHVSHFR